MTVRTLCSPVLPGAVCVAIAAVSAVLAAYDVWKVVTIAVTQLQGPAFATDFLNLYAGAYLLTHRPELTYRLDEQLAVQRALTGTDGQPVPFYLPPYAALLLAWLGWLPYGAAYLAWLLIGVASTLLAIYWMAPRWTRWYVVIWFGLCLLFLPTVLSLGQGQTSAVLLLACAGFARAFTSTRLSSTHLVASAVAWLLKPQLSAGVLVALVLARRWRVLAGAAVVVAALGGAGVLRLGPAGTASFFSLSQQKTQETLTADPVFLIGPTMLHASHWFLGVNTGANVVAGLLWLVVVAATAFIWRRGPATDERLLLQLAVLPIASVIAAPYALIYELMPWLVSLWLLWQYTATRPAARAGLLWLVAGVWLSANIGVADPRAGGADVAALFGLCLVGFVTWLFHRHPVGIDPTVTRVQQARAYYTR
jgi:hypothetical protein